MNDGIDPKRMIAIEIRSRNFSFVVFETPNHLLDWGIRSFRRGVNAVKIPASEKLTALFDEFTPSLIVTRKIASARNSKRVKTLAVVETQARSRKIPVKLVSSKDVNRAFVRGTKYEIASALASQFPALASRLPPKRKCWQSEDYRMGIFDAAAVGVAYCNRRRGNRAVTTSQENGDSAQVQGAGLVAPPQSYTA